jgi:hypothetical protein
VPRQSSKQCLTPPHKCCCHRHCRYIRDGMPRDWRQETPREGAFLPTEEATKRERSKDQRNLPTSEEDCRFEHVLVLDAFDRQNYTPTPPPRPKPPTAEPHCQVQSATKSATTASHPAIPPKPHLHSTPIEFDPENFYAAFQHQFCHPCDDDSIPLDPPSPPPPENDNTTLGSVGV